MIPGLDKLIDAILGIATAQIQDKLQRSEAVIKLLKRLNLDPDHPPTDFTAIYQYALVEYGVGKPKPVLDLFRRLEIQQTFRQAFEQNNFPLLEKVSHEVIEAYSFGDEIQQLGIDWRRELVAFSAVFIGVAKRSRTPAEVLRDQQVRSLHQHLVALQERLDRLPTIEGIRTEMARLAGEEVLALPAAEQGNLWAQQCRAYALSQQMRGWFETLGFRFEAYEVWQADYFEWIINVPVRRGRYDRILVRGMDGEAGLPDMAALRQSVEQQRTDEGWLVTARRISRAAWDEVEKKENENLGCYTLDELLDQDADFSGYLDWLEQEIERRKIDQTYVPLACTKEEFDPISRQRIGVSHYDERDGWIDGYIDLWLDDPAKEHISVLGEFGTGKTWFALHYAWQALQQYKEAKRRGLERPRLPLVIPLRDYAKAVSVESLFSEFFFRKYEIPIPGYSVFEQLNRMGKLLLIFDGFDEMAARVDRQEMINNFWELAKVVVPGAKVILTCRIEHFPEAKEGRALLNAELQASTKSLTGETPQFEVLELEKFNDDQIRQVLSLQAQPATVEQVIGNPQLLDLARRPVMTELILEALPDIEAGKPIDMSRIYLYAVRRKMERDIKAERTFTSMAEKLYFLCELSWEMLSTDRMSINYREFPDRIRRLFGASVQEEKDLDHWHYDMMGQTMLIRNAAGDYTPAHRSLLEFFVAYKFAAELGVLAPDFVGFAQAQSCLDAAAPSQDYTWSSYFQRRLDETGKSIAIPPLRTFSRESSERLRTTFGKELLLKATTDLLLPMLTPDIADSVLLDILKTTQNKIATEVGYVGGNAATLLLKTSYFALENQDLNHAVILGADFSKASLRQVDLTGANLTGSIFTEVMGEIHSVAFSPDGRFLAIAGSSGSVELLKQDAGSRVMTGMGHKNWVRSLAFSPSGEILATGSSDRTIRLWRVSDRTCLKILEGHTEHVACVVFSPDGQTLASSGFDGQIKLWNINSGECINTLSENSRRIRSVAFSLSGEVLASGEHSGSIKLWDIRSGKCLRIFQGHTEEIFSVTFHPSGEILASGSNDQTVRIWDVESGNCLQELPGHTGSVWSVRFDPSGERLASTDSATVRVWDVSSGGCSKTFSGHTGWVFSVAFNPVSGNLASGSSDQAVRIWDANSGECLRILQGYTNQISALAFHPLNGILASGGSAQTIKLWNIENGQRLKTLREHTDWIHSIAFNPTGEVLASSSADHSIKLWSADGRCLMTLRGHTDSVKVISFSPSGDILVSGSKDRTLKLWDVKTGDCLGTLLGHKDRVFSGVFHPSGKFFISGSSDHTIRLWDIQNGECLQILEGHQDWIRSIAVSPSGQLIASSSSDLTVKIWDFDSRQCTHTLTGHKDWVNFVTFGASDQILVSGSYDHTIRVWNAHTGGCVNVLQGHSVLSGLKVPDSQILVTGGSDDSIRFWDLDKGKCLQVLRDRPYEGMNITGVKGLTEAEKATLKALGAIGN